VSARSRANITEDEVRELVFALGGDGEAALKEYAPRGTVRTFRSADHVLRIDDDPDGVALAAEADALAALDSALVTPIAPALLGAGDKPFGGVDRRWLAYPFVEGHTLDADEARARATEVGTLFGSLHSARVFDLFASFPRRRPMTLMESFKRTSDHLRQWTLAREIDGLSQDLLTLTLTDLQRAMREWAMALDHLFLTSRRRVLCHGDPSPDSIVARDDGTLALVALGEATLGDPAEDLALFSIAAGLDELQEQALLFSYLDRLAEMGRPDPRFIPRFFARRTLALLARPVARLDRMRRIKDGEAAVTGDRVVALEAEMERCYDELARAMNGLRSLQGGSRPVARREVEGMGRLIAYEELILSGRSFRIAVTGLPYVGKTEVGSTLARRLGHAYVNTAALGRAIALFERRRDEREEPFLPPHELVGAAFEAGLQMRAIAEAPYYEVAFDDDDVTVELHRGEDQVRGAALLDDEDVRAALRDELSRRYLVEGVVIEGHYAGALVSGRARHFHLTCDVAVRRARLRDHRADIDSDNESRELLERLDSSSVPPADDAHVVDLGSRPAAAAAREILWHLLPPNRRPQLTDDMSGRPPLYS
jgi:cytidylate kinase/aminoglycoside phosphotransferase (APT) family kinase protein